MRAWGVGLVFLLAMPGLLPIPSPLGTAAAADQTLFSDDFEGVFPGTGYGVGDDDNGSGLDHWGPSTARSVSGSQSLWCAEVGTTGGTPNVDLGLYDTFMLAWFGFWIPRLEPQSTANLSFMMWLDTDWPYDVFRVLVGESDAIMWYVFRPRNDTGGWVRASVDLPYSVQYIRFEFYSNSDTVFEGAYIDDVLVTGSPAPPAPPPDTTPPEIAHTPVSFALPQEPVEIVATITDDIDVMGATLRYSVRDSSGDVAAWVPEFLEEVSPGRWSGMIPNQPPGITFYYLEAWDTSNNVVRLPTPGSSAPFAITIGDANGPPVSSPWLIPVFGVAVLAVFIVAALVAARRRGKRA